MEKPLCPVCKARHFAREGHAFKEEGGSSRSVPEGGVGGAVVRDGEGGREVGVGKPGGFRTPEGKFDRKAYQRDLMRKRRAVKV